MSSVTFPDPQGPDADARDSSSYPRELLGNASGSSVPIGSGRGGQANRRWARYGFLAFAVIALAYAPLAINYMWRYFAHGAVQLQASVTGFFDGHSYAVGYGSVDWARATAYQSDRWVMLIHTTLGGLCLILGVLQFMPQVRRRWPRAHRWTGRLYLAAMSVCMVTAMLFLAHAGSVEFLGGMAFFLQLWALALGTLVTGWMAYAMIRRRNVVAHQGFMMLSFALLMTAPGLRVLWIGIHPLFRDQALLMNLGASAIAEAVLAPSLGVAAFILTRPSRAGGTADNAARPTYVWATLAGLIGAAAVVLRFYLSISRSVPREMLLMYLVPLGLVTVMVLWLARRANRAGRHSEERRWRILYSGVMANTVVVNLAWLPATLVMSQVNACIASLMVAAAIPIGLSGIAVIADASPKGLGPLGSKPGVSTAPAGV
ncbi:MAG: DUF2306 domain-containing protein [Solirubrobacterales bacterium]|nr:DUF2306 domain-containing protein [Solirubrobacterales bacterium]